MDFTRPPAVDASRPPGPPGFPQRSAPENSGLAIASMICSLVSPLTCGISALVGIVLGHLALKDMAKTGRTGKGMAITGLVVGYIAALMAVLLVGTSLTAPVMVRHLKAKDEEKVVKAMAELATRFEIFRLEQDGYPDLETQKRLAEENGIQLPDDEIQVFVQLDLQDRSGAEPPDLPAQAGGSWIYYIPRRNDADPQRPVMVSPIFDGPRWVIRADGSVDEIRVEDPLPEAPGGTVEIPSR